MLLPGPGLLSLQEVLCEPDNRDNLRPGINLLSLSLCCPTTASDASIHLELRTSYFTLRVYLPFSPKVVYSV